MTACGGLMAEVIAPWLTPVLASGASKVVMARLRSRRKRHSLFASMYVEAKVPAGFRQPNGYPMLMAPVTPGRRATPSDRMCFLQVDMKRA